MCAIWWLRQNQPEHATHPVGQLLLGLHESSQHSVQVQRLPIVVVVADKPANSLVSLPKRNSTSRFVSKQLDLLDYLKLIDFHLD